MVINAFPTYMRNEVAKVFEKVHFKTQSHFSIEMSEACRSYRLGEFEIRVPYRVYYADHSDSQLSNLDYNQKLILHSIQSRSHDGFVREKHLKAILKTEFQEWCLPFIVGSFDDYVVEILQTIYAELIDKDTINIRKFCEVNSHEVKKSYDRMISYWNCYYRWRTKRLPEYVGYKIFRDFAGFPKKSLD